MRLWVYNPPTHDSSGDRMAAGSRLRKKADDRGAQAGDEAVAATSRVDLSVLTRSIGYQIRRAQLSIFEDFIRAFAAIGLRPAQFSVLVIVDSNPGLKQSEIAAALGIQRTNFVAMMDELEKRGLAARTASPSDRRSYAVKLTPEGRVLLKQALAIHAAHEKRMMERIGREAYASLMPMLSRLAEP